MSHRILLSQLVICATLLSASKLYQPKVTCVQMWIARRSNIGWKQHWFNAHVYCFLFPCLTAIFMMRIFALKLFHTWKPVLLLEIWLENYILCYLKDQMFNYFVKLAFLLFSSICIKLIDHIPFSWNTLHPVFQSPLSHSGGPCTAFSSSSSLLTWSALFVFVLITSIN